MALKDNKTQINIDDFNNFKGETIRSREHYTVYQGIYFWAKFDDNGIQYGSGDEGKPTSLTDSVKLSSTDPFNNNKADFTDGKGSIKFDIGDDGKIKNIIITLKGEHHTLPGTTVGTETSFNCQFVSK